MRVMELLDALADALADTDSASAVTSIRQPESLRHALRIAVDLGFAPNANEAVNLVLRERLEVFIVEQALADHYRRHPEARPSLAEEAHALAIIDHSPLAERPEVFADAAAEVLCHDPSAHADDVLRWAELRERLMSGVAQAGARRTRRSGSGPA
jgi:hypothetical protein